MTVPPQRLVAGVDCSTQSTKVVVVDIDSGQLVATGSSSHELDHRGGSSESDPDGWWAALAEALAQTGRTADIAAISVAAQQLSLVVTDGRGQVLRPAILWNDTRSAHEAWQLEDALGGSAACVARLGSRLRPGQTLPSWAWLRTHEPDVADRTRAIRLPHDFLTERLSGEAVTDRGDASAAGWWAIAEDRHAPEVLAHELVQIDSEMMPRVLRADEPAGSITPSAAEHTGLRVGIPVGCGTGDNMAAAVALAIEPGEPVISLGTSGTVYARSDVAIPDPSGRLTVQASASGDFLPLGCVLNATLATDRFAEMLSLPRAAVADRTSVVAMPYFGGERLPDRPLATGTITGVRGDTTAQEILLAAYEGVVYSILDGLAALYDSARPGISDAAPITLVGGGAQGKVWQDTIRRFSGRALALPEEKQLVAWGAAAQAAATLTGESSVEIARRWAVRRGPTIPARECDDAALERIRDVREAAEDLNRHAF